MDTLLIHAAVEKSCSVGIPSEGDAPITQWTDIYTPDAVMIRPSGNPMGQKIWDEMMGSADVSQKFHNLLTIEKVDIEGSMASVLFTSHGQFEYKGTPNDDVTVFLAVFRKIEGKWMITMAQRSTGRKPDDDKPNFVLEPVDAVAAEPEAAAAEPEAAGAEPEAAGAEPEAAAE